MEASKGLTEDQELNIDTYRKNATAFAKKFDALPIRISDINRVLSFCSVEQPNIIEIGCGSGRDAQEIVKHAGSYLGLDISPELLELARKKVSDAHFEVADVTNYSFPSNIDVVFAFASLIHLDREQLANVLKRIAKSLNPDGLVMLSMKYGAYKRILKNDYFGARIFYSYTPELVEELAAPGLKKILIDEEYLRGQQWFEIIFQKSEL